MLKLPSLTAYMFILFFQICNSVYVQDTMNDKVERYCLSATYTCRIHDNPTKVRNCFILTSQNNLNVNYSDTESKTRPQDLSREHAFKTRGDVFDLAPAPLRKARDIPTPPNSCNDIEQLVCWNKPNEIKTSCRKTIVGQIQSETNTSSTRNPWRNPAFYLMVLSSLIFIFMLPPV